MRLLAVDDECLRSKGKIRGVDVLEDRMASIIVGDNDTKVRQIFKKVSNLCDTIKLRIEFMKWGIAFGILK